MDNTRRGELEDATNEYVGAAKALYAVHADSAELLATDNVVKVPENYEELLANYRKTASRYADALEANDLSVPAGLREEIEQA